MTERLQKLREAMKAQPIAAYIQPVHDEYMGEYPPACNRRLEWLTGFSGSAGSVAVTANKAALFTDGRYTIQAKNETDGTLFEQHNSADTSPATWLAGQLEQGDRVGYDAKLYTASMLDAMQAVLGEKAIVLVPVENVIDPLWQDRPAAPATEVFVQPLAYAGEDAVSKRQRLAAQLKKAGVDAALITTPEAVCWLLNIRGRDVENTPVVLAFAILSADGSVQLFVDPERCDAAVTKHLGGGVTLLPPQQLQEALTQLGAAGTRVLCDAGVVPVWFKHVLEAAGAVVVQGEDPCRLPKAIKNAVELQGFRDAHLRDGAAVVKLLHWLDTQSGALTEMDVCKQLHSFRAQHAMFVEPSFDTISGSGPNGAIVHYRVSQSSNRTLQANELFLLDSGGQYPDGTTDITRTVVIGEASAEQKDRFTRVLKGHIAIATAEFAKGTPGSQLDPLARQYLQEIGLDYEHGTGHGVGHFLSVHEGPQRISKRGGDVALQAGMILSNEPGYYKAGEYGIRIENLVAVIAKGAGLAFETLTCAPIDTRLVEASLLMDAQKQWLNAYHEWVYDSLSVALDDVQRQWLQERCAPI